MRLSSSSLAMTSPGLQYLCWRLLWFRSAVCVVWNPIPFCRPWRVHAIFTQGPWFSRRCGQCEVLVEDWKSGCTRDTSILLLMRPPAVASFVCLFIYAVSVLTGQSHPLCSQLLWSGPYHSSKSHPLASVPDCSNATPSLCPFSPRYSGSFLFLLISELPHHPSLAS